MQHPGHIGGGLPQQLVTAGVEILAECGSEGLTLRRIAARAGVSHAAPAHHFDGLPGLRRAIATRGFQMFIAGLQQQAGPARDPFQALLTMNRAYIGFAEANPALFRLMFEEIPRGDEPLRRIAIHSYMLLRHALRPFTEGRDAAALETAVWAMTHGYAAMHLGRPRPPGSPLPTVEYEHLLRLLIAPDQQSPE